MNLEVKEIFPRQMDEVVLSPVVTNQLDHCLVRGRDGPSRPVRHEKAEAIILQRDGQDVYRMRFVALIYVPGQVRHDKTRKGKRAEGRSNLS